MQTSLWGVGRQYNFVSRDNKTSFCSHFIRTQTHEWVYILVCSSYNIEIVLQERELCWNSQIRTRLSATYVYKIAYHRPSRNDVISFILILNLICCRIIVFLFYILQQLRPVNSDIKNKIFCKANTEQNSKQNKIKYSVKLWGRKQDLVFYFSLRETREISEKLL